MNLLIVKHTGRVPSLASASATSFLYGSDCALCQRSEYLNQNFISLNPLPTYAIKYNTSEQALEGDGFTLYANSTNAKQIFGDFPAINLASIDVGELWILLRLLASRQLIGLEFFYLTPDNYGGSGVGASVKRKQVSISGGRWQGLPGLITPWNIDGIDFRQFSFLGFDVHRIGSIDSYEGFPDNPNRTFILADPPTAPYWLERSLRDNHELISDVMQDRVSTTPIERMAGMCPATVNAQLRRLRGTAANHQRWCLLPLGPKIQTLGAIIFTSNQLEIDNNLSIEPTVGILYDFPKPNADMTRVENSPKYYWRFELEVLQQ